MSERIASRGYAIVAKDTLRRDGRAVEGARLESVYGGNSIQGSNPCLSAIQRDKAL
jgi:hypothetical protein